MFVAGGRGGGGGGGRGKSFFIAKCTCTHINIDDSKEVVTMVKKTKYVETT